MNRSASRCARAPQIACALLLLLVSVVALPRACIADERILDFHSDIRVAPDASMEVTETIHVRAEGQRIRHGLYRDFPILYRDGHGNRVRVGFEPQSLTRDGSDEAFHDESHGNGMRVYFGAPDVVLKPGGYTYVFRYHTTRQLGFFSDHDELYWNATGNGWDFPIDAASAAVTLPGSIARDAIKVEAYTGAQGAKGTDYSAQVDAPSHALFRTTRALAPHEGLTIVVSFPKGTVTPPATAQHVAWFLGDNRGVLVLGLGLLLLWAYYLRQWWRVGRDPRAGVIIPQYDPPAGMTPGALRHVERMRWDDRCVAADLVDLGVRGALVIRKDTTGYHLVGGTGAHDPLPPTEATLLGDLLGDRNELALNPLEHTTIATALSHHRANLAKNDVGRFFETHSNLVGVGGAITLVVLVLGVFALDSSARTGDSGFLLIWLGAWSIAVCYLLAMAFSAWRSVAHGNGGAGRAAAASAFVLPFLLGEAVGFTILAAHIGFVFPLAAFALMTTNVAFYFWLKAPTTEGRQLLDKIAGLRLYLGVAERDDLALAKAPPMSADEFQRFLPYALALDVEKTWADRFAAAVGPAAVVAASASMVWYQGDSSHLSNLGSFASGLGSSFSSAISSSSSAPGSSSGGGGGGSSGGGGGGGGGGW